MTLPLVDLAAQHLEVADEVGIGIADVLDRAAFVGGHEIGEFEREYAAYVGADHCVGAGNGTDALELALRASGIGPGDEVIVPANTFVASAEAVVRAGARVVFADCDENFLIDPVSVGERMTAETRAVIAVHLYGQAAPVDELRLLVGPDVVLVEDAAQAQGARSHGRRAGSLGDVAGTSFYPGKNLGAYGDAGAVITSSDAIAAEVRALSNHGGVHKYEHLRVGTNSRLDSLQAVVLSAKLALLDEWNAERRRLAARYTALLDGTPGVVTPRTAPGNEHVFHQFVVRVPQRDRVFQDMSDAGIGVGIHYPLPVHQLPAFADAARGQGAFPVAEHLSAEILSLPIYPGLTDEQQDRVVDTLRSCL